MLDALHFIFDLDGTITHPQKGIVGSYRYMFSKLGLPVKKEEELLPLIGPSLNHVLGDIFKLPREQVDAGISYYREYYYQKGGMYEAFIFEGMRDLFECLVERGKILHVATNKALQVDKILEHFGVLQYFTSIEHYSVEKNVTRKETMINNILVREKITDKRSVVMIGDRDLDLCAARNCGILAIGILHGFGSRKELDACQPQYIVNNAAELRKLICPAEF
jgi:phosphoglycolate phosphatase